MIRTGFFILLIVCSLSSAWAETYDLETFLLKVKQNSKDLKLADKELDMAAAVKKEAWASALPKIFAQGDYKRNLLENLLYVDFPDGQGGTVKQKFKISRNNDYRFNAVLQQPLFSFLIGNALKAAGQYEELSKNVYDASFQGIMTFAKKGFYQALLLQKVLEVSKEAEASARENYENVKKKFENGLVSELDLLQAEVGYKNEVPKTLSAQKNYLLMLATLKNFAGFDKDADLQLNGDFLNYPLKPQSETTESVLNQRPDFQAMVWEKKMRKTNISAQRAGYYPYLDGSFIYAYSSQSDLWKFENENNNFILGLTLNIPLYTGGYTGAQVQKAKIEYEKSQIRIEKTEEKINNELENIILRLDESEQRIAAAKSVNTTAEKAWQVSKTSADNGVITQLDLNNTRLFLNQAKLNYYLAVFDYLSAYFDWQLATGNVKE